MAAADNMTAEDEAAVDNMVLGSAAADESGGESWGGEVLRQKLLLFN